MARRVVATLAAAACLAACGGTSGVAEPGPSPSPSGDVPKARLESALLQSADLSGLGSRRAFAADGLTTQATPQLSLCVAPSPVAPHEIANVIASSPKPGGVKVFEVLSVFADEKSAKAAYDADVAAAHRCTSYSSGGVAHRITQLAPVQLGPGVRAIHYALVTSDVVSGDVRTYAQRGRWTVLVSGFGAPPTGGELLAYQESLMVKALARLP
jgi:hypothetical protein